MSTGDYYDTGYVYGVDYANISSSNSIAYNIVWPNSNPFNAIGVCHYCDTLSGNNLSLDTVLVCKLCIKKVIDVILKPNLNINVIRALRGNLNSGNLNGESKERVI